MVLYYDPMSAPCRTVLLTAEALNIELELKHLNLREGDHMKPKFLKVTFLNNILQDFFYNLNSKLA